MESNAQPANDRTSLLEDSDWLRTRTVSLILFAGIVLMLLAPARWTGNGDIHPWADDPVAYEKIASAAPGFPDGHIASAHSEPTSSTCVPSSETVQLSASAGSISAVPFL